MSARGDPLGFNHLQSLLGYSPSGTRHVFDGVYVLPNYKCSANPTIRGHNLSGLSFGAGQQPVPTGNRPSSSRMALHSSSSMDRMRGPESSVYSAYRSEDRLQDCLPTMVNSALQQLPALLHDSFPQYFSQQPPQPVSPSPMAQSPNQSQPAPTSHFNNPLPKPPPPPPPNLLLKSTQSSPAHLSPPQNLPHQDPYDAIRDLDNSYHRTGASSSDQQHQQDLLPVSAVQGANYAHSTDPSVGNYYGDPRYDQTCTTTTIIDSFIHSLRPYHVSENPESWIEYVEREANRFGIYNSQLLLHIGELFQNSDCTSVKIWWKCMHMVTSKLTSDGVSPDLIWLHFCRALIHDFARSGAVDNSQARLPTPSYVHHMYHDSLRHPYRPPPPPDRLLIPHHNSESVIPALASVKPSLLPLQPSNLSAHFYGHPPSNSAAYNSSPDPDTIETFINHDSVMVRIFSDTTAPSSIINSSSAHNNCSAVSDMPTIIALSAPTAEVFPHKIALRSSINRVPTAASEPTHDSHFLVAPFPIDAANLVDFSIMFSTTATTNSSSYSSSSDLHDTQTLADTPIVQSMETSSHIPSHSLTVPLSQSLPPLLPSQQSETLAVVQGLSTPQPHYSPFQSDHNFSYATTQNNSNDEPDHELNPMESTVETAPAITVNSTTVHNNWPLHDTHISDITSSAIASSPENSLWSPALTEPITSSENDPNPEFYIPPCNYDRHNLMDLSETSLTTDSGMPPSPSSSLSSDDIQNLADQPTYPSMLISDIPSQSPIAPTSPASSPTEHTVITLRKNSLDSLLRTTITAWLIYIYQILQIIRMAS